MQGFFNNLYKTDRTREQVYLLKCVPLEISFHSFRFAYKMHRRQLQNRRSLLRGLQHTLSAYQVGM